MTTRAIQSPSELRPEFRSDATVRFYGDEAVATPPGAAAPMYFDPLLAVVHQFFDGETTLEQIADDVHEVIGVPASIAQTRLRQIVDVLEAGGFLAGSEPPAVEHPADAVLPGPPNP